MKIHPFYTHSQLRNFCYILEYGDKEAIVLDPWDDEQVNGWLSQLGLKLQTIINTHEHFDHVQGNTALVAKHGCEVWAHSNGEGKVPQMSRSLSCGEIIELGDDTNLKILDTPGHTFAHLCLLLQQKGEPQAVFSGDTLFNAGVGHCRGGGDVDVLYRTIVEQFHTLPDHIAVYPGHEYLENNLRFTLSVEPDNRDAAQWLQRLQGIDTTVSAPVTCIGDERLFNSFFRLNSDEIRSQLDCGGDSDRDVFAALRARRDQW